MSKGKDIRYIIFYNGKQKEIRISNYLKNEWKLNCVFSENTLEVQYYVKDFNSAKYFDTLRLSKTMKGDEILDNIIKTLIKRENEQILEETKIFLPEGLEMKKTYFFPSNLIHFSAKNADLEWLQSMNSYYRELDISPIIVKRNSNSDFVQINVQFDRFYEYDADFPLLDIKPTKY